MSVTLLQTPSTPFDQTYGPNPVTLTGIPTNPSTGAISADKYVLQIFRAGTMIANLRQTPNSVGNAIFDIQNVLQNFIAPSPNNIEETGLVEILMTNSANESMPYTIEFGSETGSEVLIDGSSPLLLNFGGTKQYYEVPYNPNPYIPLISYDSGGVYTAVVEQAQPFTDLKEFRLGKDITDGKPNWLTDTMRVYDHYVTINDMTTISYYNSNRGIIPENAQGIEAFKFELFIGNDSFREYTYYNTNDVGGGPNEIPGQGLITTYPLYAITLGTGPKNFKSFKVQSTHYYVSSHAYSHTTDPEKLTIDSLHYVHRFNIIKEDCNDFPQYQFSWLNSYGFRDYFSFRKRKDRSVKINRNEFFREGVDYNTTLYTTNIYERGTTVYSQDLSEEYTAFTNYLTDAEALYLQGLFTSVDVKVRFNDSNTPFKWIPINILNTDYTEKTVRKDQLFQYNIKFKLAHKLKSQRG